MSTYKMVVTHRGSGNTKTEIGDRMADVLTKYTMKMPSLPSGGTTSEELLLPKQMYDTLTPRLVEMLRDQSLANDAIAVLEAMETDHTAIIIERT